MSQNADMKKFLQVVNGTESQVSVITEGKDPKTNRLSVAEQMAMQHFQKGGAKEKDTRPSVIGPYLEAIEQEHAAITEARLEEAYKLSQKVMEKLYPGTMSRHIAQSQTPAASVKQSAKQSAARMVGEADEVDTVTLDIPLLIRLFEYAREDAKTDMDLHSATERLIELGKEHGTLSMDQYEAIVGTQKALPAPDDVDEGWKSTVAGIAAAGAIGAAINGTPPSDGSITRKKVDWESKVAVVQGKEFVKHSLPADMSKVKRVKDENGKEIYAWVEKSGMKPQYTYYWWAPVQQNEEIDDTDEAFDPEEFSRHMAKLKAQAELRKTNPMKALVKDLVDKDQSSVRPRSFDDTEDRTSKDGYNPYSP